MDTNRIEDVCEAENYERQDAERARYERDLKRRQEEHLRGIQTYRQNTIPWRPCLHDSCPECVGTGRKRDGTACVHCLSCPCPKCTPYC